MGCGGVYYGVVWRGVAWRGVTGCVVGWGSGGVRWGRCGVVWCGVCVCVARVVCVRVWWLGEYLNATHVE